MFYILGSSSCMTNHHTSAAASYHSHLIMTCLGPHQQHKHIRTSNAPRHHTHCTTWGPHQVLHYNTSGTAFDHIFMYMIQYQHLRSTASTCTCYLIRICLHLLPKFPQWEKKKCNFRFFFLPCIIFRHPRYLIRIGITIR